MKEHMLYARTCRIAEALIGLVLIGLELAVGLSTAQLMLLRSITDGTLFFLNTSGIRDRVSS